MKRKAQWYFLRHRKQKGRKKKFFDTTRLSYHLKRCTSTPRKKMYKLDTLYVKQGQMLKFEEQKKIHQEKSCGPVFRLKPVVIHSGIGYNCLFFLL